jgi:integrase
MKPPRRSERPSSATRASYYREGRLHLRRAEALHPHVSPLEALVRDTETPLGDTDPTLRPATTRRYLENLRVVVSVLVRAGRRVGTPCDPELAMARIDAALKLRRGRPKIARGASLRVTDPTEDEARLAFSHLKNIALRDRSFTAAAAAVYVLVNCRVGCRPVELCGAVIAGKVLHVRNAKRVVGQDEWRSLDLEKLPDVLVEATRLLTLLAPPPGNPRAFELWRNGLASSLARASRAAGGRRLPLYAFRHVAISTWEKAGFSAEEIAALAGHLSLETAPAHYARAKSGWVIESLPSPVKQVPDRELAPDLRPATNPNKWDPLSALEPMPEPPASQAATNAGNALFSDWSRAQQAEIEDLSRRLRERARPAAERPTEGQGAKPPLGPKH